MKRHWYEIKFEYLDISGRLLFSWKTRIGLSCQSDILDGRKLKQLFSRRKMVNENVRHLLCNGQLDLTFNSYLGKFRGGGTSLRVYIEEMWGELLTGYLMCEYFKAEKKS